MRIKILAFFVFTLFMGCEKDSKPDKPSAALLTAPAKDETCTTGNINSPWESTILFKWERVLTADSYKLNIKNLESGTTTSFTTKNSEFEVKLNRDTPYSWFVVSKSNIAADTAKSEVWKFYNPGVAKSSYAPFPAEILNPIMGQNVTAINGKIDLDWSGSDVDNDIVSYDVYLGTSTSPALLSANLKASLLNDVSVTSSVLYYWKVVTKDVKGNSSDSGIYQFKIN
ncbi:MAG: hypothetical protein H7Y07_07350 [Pyrinomonadaceae bacterium]|nr:hypothetical protein [Sphingobacteriaceae bacterium]